MGIVPFVQFPPAAAATALPCITRAQLIYDVALQAGLTPVTPPTPDLHDFALRPGVSDLRGPSVRRAALSLPDRRAMVN